MNVTARIALLAALVLMTACAATPQAKLDPLGAAPADFTVDVTVLVRPESSAATEPADSQPAASQPSPAEQRPARYVLLADGSLRSGNADDHEIETDWRPPITRVLSRRQIAEIWSMAQQLGLADPSAGDAVANFNLIEAKPGERVYLVALSGSGEYWNFIRRSPIDADPDPAIAKFVRLLAQLSWADEMPDTSGKLMPRRYDFGPDPYARYRQSGSSSTPSK
jgi:hypothetical protein